MKLTREKRREIGEISKEFASGFDWPIEGSGWLIVDPLSGYLNSIGIKNTLSQLPKNDKHGQVLIIEFEGGEKFIPAGADLKPLDERFDNYMWIL